MFLLICFFLTGCTLESERFSDETVETSVDSNVLSENEDLSDVVGAKIISWKPSSPLENNIK